MPADNRKICVACNQSCDGQPRIKDPKGRYFHQQCYEEVKRAQKRKQREQERAAAEAFEAPAVSGLGSGGTGGDDDIMSMLLDDVSAQAPPVMTGRSAICPSCGHPLGAGAVICMNCGFNAQSGHAVHTALSSARPAREPIWPTVIGTISLVVVTINIGIFALNVVGGLASGSSYEMGRSVGRSVIPLLFTIWLLWGAIGVLRRSQSGFARLRAWSIWKTILTILCGGAAFIAVLVAGNSMSDRLGPEFQGMGNMFAVLLGIGLAWELSWPLFCLIWTHRDAVQKQVKQW